MAAAPAAMDLVSFREDIERAPFVDATEPRPPCLRAANRQARSPSENERGFPAASPLSRNIGGRSGAGTASVSFADGSVTTIVYAYHNGFAPSGCHVFGRVIAG